MLPWAPVASIYLSYVISSEVAVVFKVKYDCICRNKEVNIVSQATHVLFIVLTWLSLRAVSTCSYVLNNASIVVHIVFKSNALIRPVAFVNAVLFIHLVEFLFYPICHLSIKFTESYRTSECTFRVAHVSFYSFWPQHKNRTNLFDFVHFKFVIKFVK